MTKFIRYSRENIFKKNCNRIFSLNKKGNILPIEIHTLIVFKISLQFILVVFITNYAFKE